ncbi:MAG: LptF/LptG family permease [Phycisphaerales bacterium]|nr:LptF/LptG family permease [Phycisphaerales bacterium]
MTTLHGYILRELLKTFGLTLLALTAVFTMGGGMYNVVKFEGVSAADLLFALPLLVPVVVTITMPVAALFAATMVYGRLAADNEFLACRAAGINVHRLFLSAALLSIFVAAWSLIFGNFVIPGMMKQIDRLARNNVADVAFQQLVNKGHVRWGQQYIMTAEKVQVPAERAVREKELPVEGQDYLLVTAPTFLRLDKSGGIEQFSTAAMALVQFDTTKSPVQATAFLSDAHDYNVGKHTIAIAAQQIGPIDLPLPIPERLSWADLHTLLRYRDEPWDGPRVREHVQDFRANVARTLFHASISQTLVKGEPFIIEHADGRRYEIRAESHVLDARRVRLVGMQVLDARPEDTRLVRYEAGKGDITANSLPSGRLLVDIRLDGSPERPVLEYRGRAGQARKPLEKPSLNLEPIEVDAPRQLESLTPRAIAGSNEPLDLFVAPVSGRAADRRESSGASSPPLSPQLSAERDQLADARASLQKESQDVRRKVIGTLNFRIAFGSSALVTILMGAALGAIFRGAKALAAFGLACLPFASVLIIMVMGRQLTETRATHIVGPYVIWGGLAVGAIVDLLMLRIGVRR